MALSMWMSAALKRVNMAESAVSQRHIPAESATVPPVDAE